MFKPNELKALFLMVGLPLVILLLYFGGSPDRVDSRGNSLKLVVLLGAVVVIPLVVRSYYKDKVHSVPRSVMMATLFGMAVIVIPLTILLRSLAYDLQNNYLTCVNTHGSVMEQRCRKESQVYFDGLYLNAGLEPGLVAFIMIYATTMVAVLGRKRLR